MSTDVIKLDDTEIIWQESNSDGVFSQIGEKTEDYKIPKDNLKLDVLMVFKKTTIREITEYLLQQLLSHSQSTTVNEIVSFLHVVILYAISPNSASIHFFENDEYREIESLFKMEYGERYIEKQNLDGIPNADSVIAMLTRHKLLEESGDKYYLKGHILKNLEIKPNE